MKQIFEPVKMNHIELKNRLVRSATWEGIANPDGSVTNEAYEIYEKLAKGGIGAMHSHPHTQITYIVSGKFEFTIGTEKKIVGAGDTLLKKNGIEHGCVCLEEGILIDCFNPMRDEFV